MSAALRSECKVRFERGFTLIELLVVFAIMALLVGLVPVAYDKMRESAQYRDVLRTMLADLRFARQQAMTTGSEVRFSVDLQERVFGIQGRTQRPVPPSLQLRATVAGVEMSSEGLASIRFLPGGGATGGSIEVARNTGAGTRLMVDWLSGQVSKEPLLP